MPGQRAFKSALPRISGSAGLWFCRRTANEVLSAWISVGSIYERHHRIVLQTILELVKPHCGLQRVTLLEADRAYETL